MAYKTQTYMKASGHGEGVRVYDIYSRDTSASGAASGITYIGELRLLKDVYDQLHADAKTSIGAITLTNFIDIPTYHTSDDLD